MKRYVISEWFDFGGGGDIIWTDDLDFAKSEMKRLQDSASMFVSYNLYDTQNKVSIYGS